MKKIAFQYGPIMFAGFLLYFLLMKALNLSENYNFRIFNGIIHLILLYMAIRAYRNQFPEEFNVLSGVSVGVMSSAVGVVPFALFQLIYLNIDTDFMQYLQDNVSMIGEYLTPFSAALILIMEGLAVSFVASYVFVRMVMAIKYDR